MNPFFAYLIKSTVSLALLYIVFRLAMHNDKTHALNRFLLLGILLVSAVIPFLNFQFFYEEVPLKQVEVFREFVSVPVLSNDLAMPNVQPVEEPGNFSFNPFPASYIFAILVLLIHLLITIIRVNQIIQGAEKHKLSKIVLAIVKDLIQPFTFFNKIVLSEKDFTENKDIVVAHEHAHIKQMHAIDLVVCELFTVLHFFNPLMWLLRRDLKLVHEYQADQAVLNVGIDAKKYQLLVLQKSVGERRFALANHFTQKPILKRIKMMHKKNKKQRTWVKIIVFVPALIILLQAFARPEISSENLSKGLSEMIKAPEKILLSPETIQNQNEPISFEIGIKKDGSYINGNLQSIDEVVSKAKAWQKTGREDILLVLDNSISLNRVDEVREALRKAGLYHVNQRNFNSDEIIYPAGDVSKLAQLKVGKWHDWLSNQLNNYLKDIPDDWEYTILYGFIIDKNGKIRDARIIEGCDYPKVNEVYEKILTQIPDWNPAIKGNNVVSVLYTSMDGRKAVQK